MSNSFLNIGRPKQQWSNFNLSNDYKFTADFGFLYPVCVRECLPGDKIKYGVESIVRLNPTLAPVLHKMDIRFEAFFVPNRLIWDNWEEYITGGPDGDSAPSLPLMDFYYTNNAYTDDTTFDGRNRLWNYFGLPLGNNVVTWTDSDGNSQIGHNFSPAFRTWYATLTDLQKREITPIVLPFRAYYKIYNDFYRDENIQSEIDFTQNSNILSLKSRCWSKNDYFTSALPFVLRGTMPALSLSLSGLTAQTDINNGFATFENDSNLSFYGNSSLINAQNMYRPYSANDSIPINDDIFLSSGNNSGVSHSVEGQKLSVVKDFHKTGPDQDGDFDWSVQRYSLKSNVSASTTIDSDNVESSINATDLRWLMQVQKFLERNARGGSRYVEQVLAHFGVYTGDYRLQRPEYLGSTKSPIIVSEVPQTSSSTSTSAQGNLAGKGLGAVQSNFVRYRCKEHGYFMVLASIVPKVSYSCQGVSKRWIKKSKYDYYFPEFSHLTEQPIFKSELYLKQDLESGEDSFNTNFDDFGYTGIYNEYRTFDDQQVGQMGRTFYYWSLNRQFSSQPALNSDFLTIASPSLNKIFAVSSEPGFIVDCYNICHFKRPIPRLAEPGLVDHF